MNQLVNRIDRRYLVENVVDQLKQAILSGKLPIGTRLRENEIAAQLGISRGTLREALRILEKYRLVESIPGRGSYIRSFSERDIKELYSLRSILEQEGIRLAAQIIRDDQIQQLQLILDKMFASAAQGEMDNVVNYDLDFHRLIWKFADHQLLLQVLEEQSLQIKMFLAVQTKLYVDPAKSIMDHQDILEAIRNRDGDRAAELMHDHLEKAMNIVSDYVQKEERLTKSIL